MHIQQCKSDDEKGIMRKQAYGQNQHKHKYVLTTKPFYDKTSTSLRSLGQKLPDFISPYLLLQHSGESGKVAL